MIGRQTVVRVALASCCLTGTQALADPMRPLAVPGKPPAPGSAAESVVPRKADQPRTVGRLVAIRQDSQGRRQALIGERWVGVDDLLGQARVAAIGPNQVELTTGKTRQTMHLLPPLQARTEAAAAGAVLAEAGRGAAPRAAASSSR